MSIDSRLAYDVWMQLIADEELYRAMIAGTYEELAESRKLGPKELEVLAALRAEPGTRWNIENLRFRTALEAGSTLSSYMPRTVRMLTNGDENWLQDIAFEYLSSHRWVEYGHHRFTECERFGAYVRDRIMKRRITPPHLESVLEFELAVIALLKRSANVPESAWPTAPKLSDEELSARRVVPGPVVSLLDLPVDIREWVSSVDPLKGSVREHPITLLMYLPSLEETHKIKALSEGPRLVFEALDGERPTGEIVAGLAAEYELDPADLLGLIRSWVDERILWVD